MSFVDRFYSFIIELSVAEKGVFEKLRLKIPKYPQEDITAVTSRVLVYLHAFNADLKFSANPGALDSPTLSQHDHSGEYASWISIGLPDLKALRLATRRFQHCAFAVYFLNESEIERFCHALRGTKENWVKEIDFFLIKCDSFDVLLPIDQTSSHWYANQSDQILYLESESTTYQVTFEGIDIWQRYQQTMA